MHNYPNPHQRPAPVDIDGAGDVFAADVRAGLSARRKSLSPKYFYDAVGSGLFEAICLTPEYYPTRAETALLKQVAAEIRRVSRFSVYFLIT